jgi:hypothetical protein
MEPPNYNDADAIQITVVSDHVMAPPSVPTTAVNETLAPSSEFLTSTGPEQFTRLPSVVSINPTPPITTSTEPVVQPEPSTPLDTITTTNTINNNNNNNNNISDNVPKTSGYISEKSGLGLFSYHHTPGQLYGRDPQTWGVEEVAAWLQSKNVASYIIESFKTEEVNGRILVYLKDEHMSTLGVRSLKERVELGILIQELRSAWGMMTEDGVGRVNSMVGSSSSMGAGMMPMELENEAQGGSSLPPPAYFAH